MYLLIDCCDYNKISLKLFSSEKVFHYTKEGKNAKLLTHIVAFLEKEFVKPEEVLGVLVVTGAGGFSSTRVASTVANTWGFVQGVPVVEVMQDEVENIEYCLDKIKKQAVYQPLHPQYSGEPNIGSPKKHS
tara:strand:- start:569 stop:961 length:393 start_codon:yes stop_codon:yes gene_type:complete